MHCPASKTLAFPCCGSAVPPHIHRLVTRSPQCTHTHACMHARPLKHDSADSATQAVTATILSHSICTSCTHHPSILTLTSLFAFSSASSFSASMRSSRSLTARAASFTTSLPRAASMLLAHASHAAWCHGHRQHDGTRSCDVLIYTLQHCMQTSPCHQQNKGNALKAVAGSRPTQRMHVMSGPRVTDCLPLSASAATHPNTPVVSTSTPLFLSNVWVDNTYSGGATSFMLTATSYTTQHVSMRTAQRVSMWMTAVASWRVMHGATMHSCCHNPLPPLGVLVAP